MKLNLSWPFHRRRHAPDEAPTVVTAREARDEAMDNLEDAIKTVDRVHDRVLDDYEASDALRKRKRK